MRYQLMPFANTIATCYKCHYITWLIGQKQDKECFLGQEIHGVSKKKCCRIRGKSYCYFIVLQSDFSFSLQNCALKEIEASTEILSMLYLHPPPPKAMS